MRDRLRRKTKNAFTADSWPRASAAETRERSPAQAVSAACLSAWGGALARWASVAVALGESLAAGARQHGGRQAAGSTQDRRAGAPEGCRERERREAGAAGRHGQAAESYGQHGVRVAEASGRGRWFSSGADRGSCSARLSGGQARTNRRTVVHWAA